MQEGSLILEQTGVYSYFIPLHSEATIPSSVSLLFWAEVRDGEG